MEEWSFNDQSSVFWGDRTAGGPGCLLYPHPFLYLFADFRVQIWIHLKFLPGARGFPRWSFRLSAPPNSSPGGCYATRRPPYPISRRHPSLIWNLTLGQDTPFFTLPWLNISYTITLSDTLLQGKPIKSVKINVTTCLINKKLLTHITNYQLRFTQIPGSNTSTQDTSQESFSILKHWASHKTLKSWVLSHLSNSLDGRVRGASTREASQTSRVQWEMR